MAVLGTNILVDPMRRRPSPNAVRSIDTARLLLDSGEALMITRLNIAELFLGAELSRDPAQESQRIDDLLAAYRILDFDEHAARTYGRIEAWLRRVGRSVGEMDVLIASVAMSNGQSVITRNPKHFVGIPGLGVHPVE